MSEAAVNLQLSVSLSAADFASMTPQQIEAFWKSVGHVFASHLASEQIAEALAAGKKLLAAHEETRKSLVALNDEKSGKIDLLKALLRFLEELEGMLEARGDGANPKPLPVPTFEQKYGKHANLLEAVQALVEKHLEPLLRDKTKEAQ